MKTIEFALPTGYRIEPLVQTVPTDVAWDLLKTGKQLNYTEAVNDEARRTTDLVGHKWYCPYCGSRIPAYRKKFKLPGSKKRKSEEEIDCWAARQLELFSGGQKTIYLHEPMPSGPEYECPRCRRKSTASDDTVRAVIRTDKKSISLSVEIADIAGLLAVKWANTGSGCPSFPMTETVVFNFKRKTAFLKLCDRVGNIVSICDITEQPQKLADGVIGDALSKYTRLCRTMKKCFAEKIGRAIPFFDNELTPEKYVLMTRFVGFDRTFFDAVPFVEDTYKIEKSFSDVAKHLSTVSGALRLFKSADLPQTKSVKRILFQTPGLLFYVRECEVLWDIIGDVNLFCRLLRHSDVFDILSQLHLYAGVTKYYRDYIAVKSKKAFVKRLTDYPFQTNYEAAVYAVLDPFRQREEQQKWKAEKSGCTHSFFGNGELNMWGWGTLPMRYRYSVPGIAIDPAVTPCKIGEYLFLWLRTTNEYRLAGRQLNNCLKSPKWRGSVVAVYHRGKILAAIEVRKGQVIQAYRRNNVAIGEGSTLGNAIEKWQMKFGIVGIEDHFFEM